MGRKLSCFALALTLLCAGIFTGVPGEKVWAAGSTKLIAFTFDDGPSYNTPTLLDGLKQRGAHATFFMAGVNGSSGIVNQSHLLDRMRDEGHQLANHTYSHIVPFDAQSASTISSQASRVEELLFQHMGGSYTDMVRTPGGATGGLVKQTVPAPLINWSVDTLDWKYRNETTVYNNILSAAGDGSIVLLHDLYSTSVKAALRAMDTLQKQGYEFVTVAELLRRRGITPENGKVYNSAPNKGTTLPSYQTPVISSQPGSAAVQVTFSSGDGLPLYYTTDGSLPNLGSKRYTGPISITKNTTFTVAGIDKYGTRTQAVTQTVAGMPRAAAPRISYENGLLTLTAVTQGTQVYFTSDGSQPTSASTLYTGSFPPTVTTKCVAAGEGYLDSPVVTCTLTLYGRLFTDVGAEQWFYPSVSTAVHLGLMDGTGTTVFSPNLSLTRAQAAQIFYNLEGKPEASGDSGFSDAAGHWAAAPIGWAHEHGVVSGYPDGTFRPEKGVTRQEFAQMLYNYGAYKGWDLRGAGDLSVYPDSGKVQPWARTALGWANSVGLLNGHSSGLIDPLGYTQRSQAAVILTKLSRYL